MKVCNSESNYHFLFCPILVVVLRRRVSLAVARVVLGVRDGMTDGRTYDGRSRRSFVLLE